LNKEVFHLKQEVNNVNLKIFNVYNEVVRIYNEAVYMKAVKFNDGVNSIYNLKQRLNQTQSLYKKVSLLNNDNVIMIKGNKEMEYKEFSKCYEQHDYSNILTIIKV